MTSSNIRLVAAVALAAGLVLTSQDSTAAGRPLFAVLEGVEEAPGPGDPDGSGSAFLTINVGQREVCFTLGVEDILLPATGAHIHRAPPGEPGPVVVPLTPPGTTGSSAGCVRVEDRDLLLEILRNPEEYYVNVHTTDFPAGAVRGQLTK